MRREAIKTPFKKVTYALILIVLALYIVGANFVLYNIRDKLSVRLSEIISFVLAIFLLKDLFYSKMDRSVKAILLWGIWSLILIFVSSLIYRFAPDDIFEGLLFLFRFLLSLLLGWLSAGFLKRNGLKIQTLKWINGCYIAVCLIGFVQLALFPIAQDWYDFAEHFAVHWVGDPHINRLISTYFDPNFMSSCLTIGFTVNLYLMRERFQMKRKVKRIVGYLVLCAVYLATILLSKSRSGFAGVVIVIFLYILQSVDYRKKAMKFLVGITVFLIVGLGIFMFSNLDVIVRIRTIFSDQSAFARVLSWQKGFEIALDNNLLGFGYNMYGAYNKMILGDEMSIITGYGNDSSLLLVFVTTGILGSILFLAHMFLTIPHGAKKEKICLVIAALFICNFNNLLFYSPWVYPFYTALYLLTATEKKSKRLQTRPVLEGALV